MHYKGSKFNGLRQLERAYQYNSLSSGKLQEMGGNIAVTLKKSCDCGALKTFGRNTTMASHVDWCSLRKKD